MVTVAVDVLELECVQCSKTDKKGTHKLHGMVALI